LSRDLGDFQTPPALAREIRSALQRRGFTWSRVLEPTCGIGNVLLEFAATDGVDECLGIELQASYAQRARSRLASLDGGPAHTVQTDSIFCVDLAGLQWGSSGRLAVVGNPPWVTNSELGAMRSQNLPPKSNRKLLTGLDAITGSANFDLTEFIWLKLLEDLKEESPVIALICKSHVARNVLQYIYDRSIGVQSAVMWRIDAQKHFEASVDACVLAVDVSYGGPRLREVAIFPDLSAERPHGSLTFRAGQLVNGLSADDDLIGSVLGTSSLTWRQGLKHDAASVMEMVLGLEGLKNKVGDYVEIEPEYCFPLMKGSDVFHARYPESTGRRVIVPQRELGEDTAPLRRTAPKLWRYLEAHGPALDGRRSSIYRGKPRFSVFGIGDYSFAPYKVAVSGLHKEPRFRAVGPSQGKPVMFDDTCYLLPLPAPETAALVASALNSSLGRRTLDTLIFRDAKRPIKKSALRRIDIEALVELVPPEELQKGARKWMKQLTGADVSQLPLTIRTEHAQFSLL